VHLHPSPKVTNMDIRDAMLKCAQDSFGYQVTSAFQTLGVNRSIAGVDGKTPVDKVMAEAEEKCRRALLNAVLSYRVAEKLANEFHPQEGAQNG